MVEQTITVKNKVGFHARPAAMLIETAKPFACVKTLRKGEQTSDLKGIISLLKLQCKFQEEVTITCDGEDEAACLEALVALIDSKFGEE